MPLARHVVRRIEKAAFATCGSSCGDASARTEVMESFGDSLGKPLFWYEIRRGPRLSLNAAAMHSTFKQRFIHGLGNRQIKRPKPIKLPQSRKVTWHKRQFRCRYRKRR